MRETSFVTIWFFQAAGQLLRSIVTWSSSLGCKELLRLPTGARQAHNMLSSAVLSGLHSIQWLMPCSLKLFILSFLCSKPPILLKCSLLCLTAFYVLFSWLKFSPEIKYLWKAGQQWSKQLVCYIFHIPYASLGNNCETLYSRKKDYAYPPYHHHYTSVYIQ